jgi:hypothetical protein
MTKKLEQTELASTNGVPSVVPAPAEMTPAPPPEPNGAATAAATPTVADLTMRAMALAELNKQRFSPFPMPRPEDLPVLPGVGLDILTLGRMLAQSGFFADVKSVSQSVAKILAGQELGIGPMRAMTDLYVITDNAGRTRISMAATLMGSLIKRSGKYDYEITRLDDTGCAVQFYRVDLKTGPRPLGEPVTFVETDAIRAGLIGRNPTYKSFPRNMYFSRAISNGAKWHCSDVFGGPIYTPEELRDILAEEQAATIAGPSATVAPTDGEPAGTKSDQLAAKIAAMQTDAPGAVEAALAAPLGEVPA